jgi:hypothetical protein
MYFVLFSFFEEPLLSCPLLGRRQPTLSELFSAAEGARTHHLYHTVHNSLGYSHLNISSLESRYCDPPTLGILLGLARLAVKDIIKERSAYRVPCVPSTRVDAVAARNQKGKTTKCR